MGAGESAAGQWQWWQPEGEDKEREGATRPAALPTQKVTLGTLLEVREALWGDWGCGFPHWLQRVKLYGQCPPFQPSPLTPQKHLGTGPAIHAHMDRYLGTPVYRHTLFQEQRETEMGETSRRSRDHALPRVSNLENHTATTRMQCTPAPATSVVLPSVWGPPESKSEIDPCSIPN